MIRITIIVDGMMCANCKATVETTVRHLKGVNRCNVNLATKKADIIYDEQKINLESIKQSIEQEGFKVFYLDQEEQYEEKKKRELEINKKKLIICIILGIIELYASMGPGLGLPFFFVNSNYLAYLIVQIILVIPVIILNINLFKKGFINLFRFHPSMESLVSIGVVASFTYSFVNFILFIINPLKEYHFYFDSSSMILVLIQLGKYFETKSLNKANSSIKSLLNKTPSECIRIVDGNQEKILIKDIKINDLLIANPGDNIAVDGIIVDGFTNIDESILTGESMPKDRKIGDKVYALTSNINGSIIYRAISIGKDTMVSKIIKMVEDAQASKAPIEKLADKVANVFTKVVISIALIAFIIWIIITKDLSFSINIFVSVLVIACPCALGLATPTAIIVASGVGARNGILFKDAETLETLGKIDTFFFDKTGTLTEGKFEVYESQTTINVDEFNNIVGTLESKSNHLIAKCICDYIGNYKEQEVTDFKEVPGSGISGVIDGSLVSIRKPLDDNELQVNGCLTRVVVEIDSKIVGHFYLADQVKKESINLISILKKQNCETIMLTGDNEKVAKKSAQILDIDKVYYDCLPLDKANIIKEYKYNKKVAMIGDGINDAVALSEADVSITLSNSTDIAISTSSIIINSGNIEVVYVARELSKKTLRHIKQNLFFAFFYNSIGIALATGIFYPIFGILLNPMIGALAMSLSSVSVVTNALRINLFKKEKYNGNKTNS